MLGGSKGERVSNVCKLVFLPHYLTAHTYIRTYVYLLLQVALCVYASDADLDDIREQIATLNLELARVREEKMPGKEDRRLPSSLS